MNKEPVAIATLIPIIVWLAAHYGFNLDEDTASAIAAGVLFILGIFARQTVTPVADPHDNDGRKLVPETTKITRILPEEGG